MEALGASERVISYLDAPPAPQIAPGTLLPNFTGLVRASLGLVACDMQAVQQPDQ